MHAYQPLINEAPILSVNQRDEWKASAINIWPNNCAFQFCVTMEFIIGSRLEADALS